ncbi:MAG TPA: hypothetical protein VFQ81_04840 [Candidatus Limnocylindria bacterium]|nr:hypothetical protein [Candidatus Limnocylindria bacterium]
MFGRKRKRQQEEAAVEAAREAERRALFAQLASRPDTVCPFLGLAEDRVGYVDGVSPEHRCYAFGDPAPLSGDQQTRVCLDRGYGNCPRYLRGVLVIPTDELEALRRPAPATSSTPPPPPVTHERRRPVAAWLIGLLLLLVVGGVGGVALISGGLPFLATASPSPSASVVATIEPTATVTTSPSETPAPPTPTLTPEPTPAPNAEFIGYEVAVSAGDYTLFELDDAGNEVDARDATFAALSKAQVERIVAPNGVLHWRTIGGEYDGLSYVRGRSGGFIVREVHRAPDGSLGYERLPDAET